MIIYLIQRTCCEVAEFLVFFHVLLQLFHGLQILEQGIARPQSLMPFGFQTYQCPLHDFLPLQSLQEIFRVLGEKRRGEERREGKYVRGDIEGKV